MVEREHDHERGGLRRGGVGKPLQRRRDPGVGLLLKPQHVLHARTGDGEPHAHLARVLRQEVDARIAYPDIETVELEVPPQRAYEVTLALIAKRKWLVIDERPPQPPRRIGRIEAVARTPIMGFREDVSIRITPDGEESRVDIRSSSRYFESDLGSNAARVSKLIEDINSAVDNAKPAQKKPQAPAKAQAKTVKKQ